MEIQSPITSRGLRTASALLMSRKRSEFLLFIVIFISVLFLVPVLVAGGIALGFSIMLAIPVVLIIAALVIRWPIVGLFVALACVLLIEQTPLPLFASNTNIYVFYWPPSLQGLPDRPVGFLMFFTLLVLICHGLLKRQRLLKGGVLLAPFLLFLVCVIWGIAHGMTSGGNLKIIVNEVRSFWYLFIGYLLAYNLVKSKRHLRYFFWFVIICAGLKGLEGTYIYLGILHGDLKNTHEIMAHEESFFFVSVLLLIVLYSLHSKNRPQLYAALIALPFVLLALVANQRRTDYVALLVGVVVAWLLIFLVKPQARKSLLILFIVCAILGGSYVAAFYKGTGGFSGPARAIVSVVYPDPTDASSNLYRINENYDLKYTVNLNPLGLGFGKPFLQPLPLVDLSALDPVYNYIPHNTIYWVWMRLGPVGYLALWYLFGAIIVRGCIIARQLKDKYLQLIAIYIVSIVVMEIIVAYADYQLSFYRNVIYVGMLAGILVKLTSIEREEARTTETKEEIAA
jgi:hypothetical protein